jgi:hypothetical protein
MDQPPNTTSTGAAGEAPAVDESPKLEAGTLEGEKQLIGVLLAQFNACRGEILARSASQATLMGLNISAVGVIAGFYFSAHADPRLLLVIPLLSPMLGIIWQDHAINIGNIGRFIQQSIMPRLKATLKTDLPDYEVTIREFERLQGRRLILLVAPTVLMFAILPLGALIVAFNAIVARDLVFWAMVTAGSVLILIFGSFSISIQFGWIWASHRNPS